MSITAIALRLLNNIIRISIGLCFGSNLCEPCVCTWAKFKNVKSTYSFPRKKSSGKIARQDLLNGAFLRTIQGAKISAKKNLWASIELMGKDQMAWRLFHNLKKNVLHGMLLFQILLHLHVSMIHPQKLELQITKPLNQKPLNVLISVNLTSSWRSL